MMSNIKKISKEDILQNINSQKQVLIDIRPVDAYNGWKLKGEKRGGHIKGAKSLPLKWANYIDWIEIVRSKGILPENNIVIYGYTEEDCLKVAKMFKKATYGNISIYNNFVDEWSANNDLPMEHLAKYKQLVSAGWVNKLISGEKPDEYDNNKYIICHSHYRNRNAYLSGHIPGAIDMDTLALEAPETWNRLHVFSI